MKTLALVLCLAAPLAFADGPSLADAAKKESERREKAKKAGAPTRTLTEDDLAAAKGALASTPGGTASAAAGTKARPTTSPSGRPEPAAGETASGEEYWRGRAGAARARVAQAQRRLDNLQAMIRFGQAEGHDENGRVVIYSMYAMKNMADEAAAELAAAQAALEAVLEEGRRSGALPGWLR